MLLYYPEECTVLSTTPVGGCTLHKGCCFLDMCFSSVALFLVEAPILFKCWYVPGRDTRIFQMFVLSREEHISRQRICKHPIQKNIARPQTVTGVYKNTFWQNHAHLRNFWMCPRVKFTPGHSWDAFGGTGAPGGTGAFGGTHTSGFSLV